VAPGVDAKAQVIERLPPGVAIADRLEVMDARLFREPAMRESPNEH
jgi:propionate CoA-transferase